MVLNFLAIWLPYRGCRYASLSLGSLGDSISIFNGYGVWWEGALGFLYSNDSSRGGALKLGMAPCGIVTYVIFRTSCPL